MILVLGVAIFLLLERSKERAQLNPQVLTSGSLTGKRGAIRKAKAAGIDIRRLWPRSLALSVLTRTSSVTEDPYYIILYEARKCEAWFEGKLSPPWYRAKGRG